MSSAATARKAARRALAAQRVASGRYTPFLEAYWGSEERAAVALALRGVGDPSAEADLIEAAIPYSPGAPVPVSSGRAALALALAAMDLPAGSEVIAPSFSCVGVVAPILQAGLAPVLCDVDDNFNISLEGVQSADGPRVSAVVVPHLSGLWVRDADAIVSWARQRGLRVIEDVAQATGLRQGDRIAGSLGDVAVYSSGLGKPLHGPGGGWVAVREPGLHGRLVPPSEAAPADVVRAELSGFAATYASAPAQRGRKVVVQQVRQRLRSPAGESLGGDWRFPMHRIADVHARLAALQLARLPDIIDRRRRNATRWHELAADYLPEARLAPLEHSTATKVWIAMPSSERARRLQQHLWVHGVETEALYTPLHHRPGFSHLRRGTVGVTDELWPRVFSLPARPSLTRADWARIELALASR